MKLIYTLIACLCGLSAYSQVPSNPVDGIYLFQSATFESFNNDTQASVSTVPITNPLLQATSRELYFNHIPTQAIVADSTLVYCIFPSGNEFTVVNGMELVPAKIIPADPNPDPFADPMPTFLPPYESTFSGTVWTIKFFYLYGNTQYNFTLKGVLTITLDKQI